MISYNSTSKRNVDNSKEQSRASIVSAVHYIVVQCNVVQCNEVQYNTVHYNTVRYNTVQWCIVRMNYLYLLSH